MARDDGEQFRTSGFHSLEVVLFGDYSLRHTIPQDSDGELLTAYIRQMIKHKWDDLGNPTTESEIPAAKVEEILNQTVRDALDKMGHFHLLSRLRFGYNELVIHITLTDPQKFLELNDLSCPQLPLGVALRTYSEVPDCDYVPIG